MSRARLYGIPTCDSCRRARRWLTDSSIVYDWIDLRADGVVRARLSAWRDLDENQRAQALDDPISMLAEHPTLIKRPILETETATLAGFSETRFESALVRTA